MLLVVFLLKSFQTSAGADSFIAVTVVRPTFMSIGFGTGVVLACRFVVRPILLRIPARHKNLPHFTRTPQFVFLGYTALLVGLVAGATNAGTSSLFAANLAGVITSSIDSLMHKTADSPIEPRSADETPAPQQLEPRTDHAAARDALHLALTQANHAPKVTGTSVYKRHCHGPVKRILIPMFFESIGFAIPVTEMFQAVHGPMARSVLASIWHDLSSGSSGRHSRTPGLLSNAFRPKQTMRSVGTRTRHGCKIAPKPPETYPIVVWAISLCTLVGPVCAETLVKRVKALQKERTGAPQGGRETGRASDLLGVWEI
ncbi:hypothetical protein BJY00DRAFT_314717 [Aspergillus carlsbadensis]|nr:hypothetical protein BJY00DRAFT_314717 [Aspergillus carlsbadensis]